MPRPSVEKRVRPTLPAATSVAAFLFAIAFALTTVQTVQAQSFHVLYNFVGGADGRFPFAGVIVGPDGSLYGTTGGGPYWYSQGRGCTQNWSGGCGTIFKLSRTQSGWNLNTLYSFRGGVDGLGPSRLIFGHDGYLYGATLWGGGGACPNSGCGTIFELTQEQGGWSESVLYRFQGPPDGENPSGSPVFDPAGNLYGATSYGGEYLCSEGDSCGTAYKLTHSNGTWNETVIWNFGNDDDGFFPSNLIIDNGGRLYGTTVDGGGTECSSVGIAGCGIAFRLRLADGGWREDILYNFNSQPAGPDIPLGGLTFDGNGNLFGTTYYLGYGGAGSVYELGPSGFTWGLSTVFDLQGQFNSGPYGSLVLDSSGNLYGVRTGTTLEGAVFKLTQTGNGWSYSELHDFSGLDGDQPAGYLAMDSSGNLYGTTTQGGVYGYGVVWEITP